MRPVSKGILTFGKFVTAAGAAAVAATAPVFAQSQSEPTPAPAATPAASKAEPAPAPAPAPPPPVTFTGYVEANYTANFNKPFNGSNTYLYNQREGQFSLNLADLHISQAATADHRYGFTIRPIAGEVARTNFNSLDYNGGPGVALLEGYGTWLLPWHGKDVKVDVGQFVTHVGYETIEIGSNNFFSRNFLFQYPSPFYDAGVRASIPISTKSTLGLYLYNRYNGTADPNNRDMAPGFQWAYNPSAATSIILNGLTSRENVGTFTIDTGGEDNSAETEVITGQANRQQSVLDLIASHNFGPSFKGVFEGLYRFGKDVDNDSYSFFGGALYGIYTMKNGNTFALRGEYMNQDKADGIILAYPLAKDSDSKPNLGSLTASYELHSGLFPGVRTLLEYRYDWAGKEFFPASNSGDYKKSQSTITIGQVFAF